MGPGRREIYNFPVESLESTQPLLLKRKKLNKTDVQPVEGWRLVKFVSPSRQGCKLFHRIISPVSGIRNFMNSCL